MVGGSFRSCDVLRNWPGDVPSLLAALSAVCGMLLRRGAPQHGALEFIEEGANMPMKKIGVTG